MPAIELATGLRISLRSNDLNELQNSIYKIPKKLDDVSIFSYRSLVKCIMGSAPPFSPTLNCRLRRSSFASEFASLVKHVNMSLPKTSPTAIGRIPPLFFKKADSDALQRACETSSGSSSRQLTFTSLVSTSKAFCGWSEAVHCTAYKTCWETFLKNQLL